MDLKENALHTMPTVVIVLNTKKTKLVAMYLKIVDKNTVCYVIIMCSVHKNRRKHWKNLTFQQRQWHKFWCPFISETR